MEAQSRPYEAASESHYSSVSWAAVLAGAVAACALSLALLALGSGIGLASLSPWSNGVSATTFGVLTVAWFTAIQLFSYAVGGYIAGRLRTHWVRVHSDEVFFRDTAHGVLVWAVGTILSAGLIASVISSAASGVAQAGGAALQGAGSVISSSVSAAAGSTDLRAYFSDMLFRSERPAEGNQDAARSEVGRIFVKALADGTLDPGDKTYVAQLIARQTGLSQADAEKRVDDTVAKAKAAALQAEDTAKRAADAARKAGVYASLWAFIALLIGAFAAAYMATVGGRLRDDLPAMS